MLDNLFLGAFLSLLVQNFTLPVSNLTHLGPLKSSTAAFQKKCKPLGFYPLKQGEMLDDFFLCAFSALLIQNFTLPVSNLTHLGPLSPPPPCLKRSAAQTTWIYPLKPTLDACRIFVWPLSRPFWFKISPFRCQT